MGYLDFFLVTCRVLHTFSAVAWIGGIAFLGGVANPVFKHFGVAGAEMASHIERRFVGFVWTTAWGLGVSGVLLMLMNDHFLWFDYDTRWDFLLLGKQMLFLTMVGSSLIISRSHRHLLEPAQTSNADSDIPLDEIIRWRITMLTRVNLVFGIVALTMAEMMH